MRGDRWARTWLAALDPLDAELRVRGEGIVFGNCPFAAVAQARPATVCNANVALVRGLLQGAGMSQVSVRLRPGAGGCCVLLRDPSC